MDTPPAKKAKQYESARKYLPSWEREFEWLTYVTEKGEKKPSCKFCRKQLKPHHSGLKKHEETPGHIAAQKMTAGSSILKFTKKAEVMDTKVKSAELHLAVTTCCHSPISSVDHYSDMIKSHAASGSTLSAMSLHRTKCTKLLTNVVGQTIKEETKKDIEGKAFSLILDESTDVSATKVLAVLVRYFSEKDIKIRIALLGFREILEASGEQLFITLKSILEEYSLDLSLCVGLATDGASNMVGEHNSLWSRVRAEAPNCVLLKCVCHSIALCIQKAFDIMPSNMGCMLSEVPSYFSHSHQRREAYKALYDAFCNEETEDNEIPTKKMPFKKMSTTRWLVRGEILKRILNHWEPLREYFEVSHSEGTQDVRYRARMLFSMFEDKTNHLYFTFLSPVVSNFDALNQLFQSEKASPDALAEALDLNYKSLKERVYDRNGDRRPVSLVDFGHLFAAEAVKLQREYSVQAVDNVKSRCAEFLIRLVSEVEKRLPNNKQTFTQLSNLTPRIVLSQMSCIQFCQLPMLHLCRNVSQVEEQYRKVRLHIWKEEEVFKDGVPEDPHDFWVGILHYTNSGGESPYRELALYALGALSCPVSNASVERIFSIVTWAKNKYRNQLATKTVEAIVLTKHTYGCCDNFKVTKQMLEKFNNSIYD